MRQVQKNNFSLRLKVVGGNLTADQLLTVAEISKKYGDGYVHLTSRQGVEIPFIKLDDVEPVKAELKAGGVDTGVCGPRVRTVTACQGSKICSSGCIDTYSLAVEISDRYFGRELPHKFKFGITGCMNNCLRQRKTIWALRAAMRSSGFRMPVPSAACARKPAGKGPSPKPTARFCWTKANAAIAAGVPNPVPLTRGKANRGIFFLSAAPSGT